MSSIDARQQSLEQWASSQLGEVVVGKPASTDASFRRYFRYELISGRTVIAMDAPPPQEDCRPFVDIAQRLAVAGLHVPTIIAQDLTRGFLLLGDLGGQTFLQHINAGASEERIDTLFLAAIDALVAMQANTATAGLPHYDEALLRKELELFPEWYLQRHLGLLIDRDLRQQLSQFFDELISTILTQPQVFVHRDFMPRNLMVSEPNPGILDFQDAVLGPISYDPICLFKDAFISWPELKVEQGLKTYWQKARAHALPVPKDFTVFQRDCDLMGVHRHLKVIGIFARICHRDGKADYLADVPRFFAYIHQVIARQPSLEPLKDILKTIEEMSR